MKKILAVIAIVFLLFVPVLVSAGTYYGNIYDMKPTTLQELKTATKEVTIVYIEQRTTTTTVVDFIGELAKGLGITPQTKELSKVTSVVQIDGMYVAEIPFGSKFYGMSAHDSCLVNQYGTDAWYQCEVSLK
jgi:hypothetical protein